MQKDFRQIITEQKEELDIIYRLGWVPREQEFRINLNSRLAQIITGVRRSGKSTLAHRALYGNNYAYVNFDDERLEGVNAESLNLLLEALYAVYGDFTHLLLDEIQNVESWPLFVNRLLRNNYKIILTGSNSELLSSELATRLTGRYSNLELLPFSFREFLAAKKVKYDKIVTAKEKGLLMGYLIDYIHSGGFPDIITGESQKNYIKTLFDSIVSKDILFRHNIRHPRTFRELSLSLTSNFSSEISYNRLKNIFGLGSENTAKNYINFLEEAYLIACLSKFSFKKQETLRYRKLYLIDTAFSSVSGSSSTQNMGRLFENLIYLELRRRAETNGFELFYYKKNVEVDFVVYHNRKVMELIQVAYSVTDDKTLKREIRALLTARKELKTKKLTIITLDQKRDIELEGITINMIPVLEWILLRK